MARQPSPHVPLRWFADRHDGVLTRARAARLDAHLAAGCVACTARDESLNRTIAALRAGPLEPAPRPLVRAAVRAHRAARVAAAVESVRRVVADLVFGGTPAPAFAMRAAEGDERRLLWTAGGWDIDACVTTGPRGANLLGQILPHDDADTGPVDARISARSGTKLVHARVGPDGRFAFRALAPGAWTLEGRAADTEFATPPFAVERAG
jgi:hypothetical protein